PNSASSIDGSVFVSARSTSDSSGRWASGRKGERRGLCATSLERAQLLEWRVGPAKLVHELAVEGIELFGTGAIVLVRFQGARGCGGSRGRGLCNRREQAGGCGTENRRPARARLLAPKHRDRKGARSG